MPCPRSGLLAGLAALTLVAGCGDGRRLHFTDVTARTGLDLRVTSGATPSTQLLEVKGGNLALIDFDGDGDEDVFVPNGATLEHPDAGPGCRLFRNDGGLRFVDVTAESGLAFRRFGFGVAVADVDGNGLDDLFICGFRGNALYMNENGHFEDRTGAASLQSDAWSTAASFGDVDGDGDLDLYLVNYLRFDPAHPPQPILFLGAEVFGGPVGLPAEPDVLYENLGDGTFRDVSAASGCAGVEPSYGLGAIILDLDADGRQDIFVGNDSQANFLFHNAGGGRFHEVGTSSGIGLGEEGAGQATMGIAIGDVRGDERPSLFTTNFMNDVNTLQVNLGGMQFEDQTKRFGLAADSRPFLGWATAFYDFDHDGDEDLVVFDGHTYPAEVTEPRGWMHSQTPLLFERFGLRFERARADTAGDWLGAPHCDRGAAFSDLDQDGDVDIVVAELNGPLRVLENDTGGDWLQVQLVDRRPGSKNTGGIGARVTLRPPSGATQTRWRTCMGGYGALSRILHFGVPEAGPYEIRVDWPDGASQSVRVESPRRMVTVAHP